MTGSGDAPAGARLFKEDVAERAGVAERTVKFYLATARARRRDGRGRPFDLPEPDGYVTREYRRAGGKAVRARAPWWSEEKITAWLAARPGPGQWERPPSGASRKARMTVRMDPDLRERIVSAADLESLPLTDAIRTALEGWCDEREAVREAMEEINAGHYPADDPPRPALTAAYDAGRAGMGPDEFARRVRLGTLTTEGTA